MSFSICGQFREQVRFLRRQFLQDGELPFTDAATHRNSFKRAQRRSAG